MPRAQDRRVLKTKAQLRTALTGLLEKKPLQEITVKELCEACNINRGTFYLHYPDVRALLDEIVNELMAQFEDMLESFRPGEMLLRSGAPGRLPGDGCGHAHARHFSLCGAECGYLPCFAVRPAGDCLCG